jgi:class 3 adenylate cyclase
MSANDPAVTSPAASPSHGFHGFLFADLRGYTAFVERHGDQQAADLLGAYRTLVRAAVGEFHGAEIKTEGDSFYVVFDSASNAVRCGLEIVAAAARANGAGTAAPIDVGVGIHAGETISTDEGFVGSAVNVAARVCAQAAAGQVLVTDTVRSLTRTHLDVEFVALGSRKLKGVSESIPLFRVMVPAAGSLPRSRRGAASEGRSRGRLPLGIAAAAALVGVLLVAAIGTAALRGSPTQSASSPASSGLNGAGGSPGGGGSGLVAPAASLGVAASGQPYPNPNEADLLSRLPAMVTTHLTGCSREAAADRTKGASDGIVCQLEPGQGATTLYFEKIPDGAQLDAAYTDVINRNGATKGDCKKDPKAYQQWTLPDVYAGWLVCYQDGQGSWVDWTYSGEGLYAQATRPDSNSAGLLNWWNQVAPFLKH